MVECLKIRDEVTGKKNYAEVTEKNRENARI